MASSKEANAMTSIAVHHTSIPGVYIDPSAIAAIEAEMRVILFQGDKTEFKTSSFKPSSPPDVKSSAGLFSDNVPGMFIDKKELKGTTCVMWQSKKNGQGMFLVREMDKRGDCFYESCAQAHTPASKHKSMLRDAKSVARDEDEEMLSDIEHEVDADDPNNEIFLHVFVGSDDGILTLNMRNRTLQLKTDQSNTPVIGRFYGEASVVQCFKYKKGRTLRLINCGLSTTTGTSKKSKLIQDKKCHVSLPADRYHTSFVHDDYVGQEESTYGLYSQEKAEHNVGVFARFMNELVAILGQNVGLCTEGDTPSVRIKKG